MSPVILSDIFGDPNVGIFSFANERIAVLPAGTSAKKLASYKETLGVEPRGIGIAESRLVGVYMSGNSNAILVPYITTKQELKALRAGKIPVVVVKENKTALGNLVLCNDYGAILDPRLKPKTVDTIAKALKVPHTSCTVAGLPHVGALATASNNGVLANPKIRDEEKKKISETLAVPVYSGTINSGVPYPKCGLVVNSKGAVVGSHTLGSELLTVSSVFKTD